jgi:hypothetical protein
MDRRILFLVAAILIGAAGLYFFLPGEQGDYAKVLIIKMHLTKGAVHGESAEVRYGHPPVTSYRSGPLLGKLITAEGKVTREFSVWDPSVQLGDAEELQENGTEVFRSVTVTSRESDLVLVLPYTGEEKQFDLLDTRTGREVATMNLSAAGTAFEKTYPADQAIASKPFPLPQISHTLIVGTVIIIFFILALIFVPLIQRK